MHGLLCHSGRCCRDGRPFDFSYSGRLVEADGKPTKDPFALKISFYHTESAPSPILEVNDWLTSVPLTDGVFQIKLALDPSIFKASFPE